MTVLTAAGEARATNIRRTKHYGHAAVQGRATHVDMPYDASLCKHWTDTMGRDSAAISQRFLASVTTAHHTDSKQHVPPWYISRSLRASRSVAAAAILKGLTARRLQLDFRDFCTKSAAYSMLGFLKTFRSLLSRQRRPNDWVTSRDLELYGCESNSANTSLQIAY